MNLENYDWKRLKSNKIVDKIIELGKIKNNVIFENLKSYIHNEESRNLYSILEKIITLKKINLFKKIPNEVLYHISQIVEEVEYLKGELVFKEGEYGDFMLIIVKGSVNIYKNSKVISELNEGDSFGEMAILDGEPRSADVCAIKDCIMFKINKRDFYQVLSVNEEIINSIILTLTKRLRETTNKLNQN